MAARLLVCFCMTFILLQAARLHCALAGFSTEHEVLHDRFQAIDTSISNLDLEQLDGRGFGKLESSNVIFMCGQEYNDRESDDNVVHVCMSNAAILRSRFLNRCC